MLRDMTVRIVNFSRCIQNARRFDCENSQTLQLLRLLRRSVGDVESCWDLVP
jgi:hypothetical protein